MIRSMTGYGRYEVETAYAKINLEISSVNHRYCDLSIRLPRALNALEDKVRKQIKKEIGRGKIDVSIFYHGTSEDQVEVVVNEAAASVYVEKLREVGKSLNLTDNIGLSDLMKLEDLISIQKKAANTDLVWEELSLVLAKALKQLLEMREIEGKELTKDLLEKAETVKQLVVELEKISPEVVSHYKAKLEERVEKIIKDDIDKNRVAVEVALFADKCAIDEELTRLKSHVSQLEMILSEGGQVGRKLDFIMQEMNREANTIASKANNYSVTNCAVELKTEIEKMREQIQNIE